MVRERVGTGKDQTLLPLLDKSQVESKVYEQIRVRGVEGNLSPYTEGRREKEHGEPWDLSTSRTRVGVIDTTLDEGRGRLSRTVVSPGTPCTRGLGVVLRVRSTRAVTPTGVHRKVQKLL